MGDTYEVTLDGGGPWGIRLQGGKDFGVQLNVARVTPGSKAAIKGILAGDTIIAINGQQTISLSHMDAQNAIKNSGQRLQMTLKKGKGVSLGEIKQVGSGGMAAQPSKTLYTTDVTHSAGVDHKYNAKPRAFGASPGGGSAQTATAKKFDPSEYARRKKEELQKYKEEQNKPAVPDSDVLKMLQNTKVSDNSGDKNSGSFSRLQDSLNNEGDWAEREKAFRMTADGTDLSDVSPGSQAVMADLKNQGASGLKSSGAPSGGSRSFKVLQQITDNEEELFSIESWFPMDALNSEIELEMNELKDQLDQAANEAAEQQALRLQDYSSTPVTLHPSANNAPPSPTFRMTLEEGQSIFDAEPSFVLKDLKEQMEFKNRQLLRSSQKHSHSPIQNRLNAAFEKHDKRQRSFSAVPSSSNIEESDMCFDGPPRPTRAQTFYRLSNSTDHNSELTVETRNRCYSPIQRRLSASFQEHDKNKRSMSLADVSSIKYNPVAEYKDPYDEVPESPRRSCPSPIQNRLAAFFHQDDMRGRSRSLGNIKNLGLNEGDNNNIDNNNNTDAINSPKYCNVLPPGVSITTASNNNDNNNNNIPKINMKKPFQFSKKLQDLYERYVLNAKDDSDHEMEQPVARTTDKLIQQGVTTIRVRSRSAQANLSIGNTGRSKSYHNIHTASATLSEKPTSFGSQNGGTYCGSFVSDPLDNCGYVIRSTKLHIKPQFIVTGCNLPPPPPELVAGNDYSDYNRSGFGNSGSNTQSGTFKMLQKHVDSGTGDEVRTVFDQAPSQRGQPVPAGHAFTPVPKNTVGRSNMPQGPNFKVGRASAPTFKPSSAMRNEAKAPPPPAVNAGEVLNPNSRMYQSNPSSPPPANVGSSPASGGGYKPSFSPSAPSSAPAPYSGMSNNPSTPPAGSTHIIKSKGAPQPVPKSSSDNELYCSACQQPLSNCHEMCRYFNDLMKEFVPSTSK